ncbi:MAG: sugar nucleotide-binding protein [Chloroflexi bacterium]|nr:sugar nucleotide-binding protein [Chloroflexota bacterium]
MTSFFDPPVTVACTGLSGFVGSGVIEALGKQFTLLDLFHSSPALGVGIGDHIQLPHSDSDLNRLVDELSTRGVRSILNIGGVASVDACESESGDRSGSAFLANVIQPREFARSCAHSGVRFVHVSTDYVFDGKEGPYRESDVSDGAANWYGETKRLGELAVLETSATAAIVRIALPYGPDHPRKSDIVRLVRSRLAAGEIFAGAADQLITPTWLGDIAETFVWLLNNSGSGIYHCGGATLLSPYEAALITARTFGLDESLIQRSTLAAITVGGRARRPQLPALLSSRLLAESGGAVRLCGFAEGVGHLR